MLSDGFDRHFARINLCKTCSGNRPVGKLESSIGMEECSNLVLYQFKVALSIVKATLFVRKLFTAGMEQI